MNKTRYYLAKSKEFVIEHYNSAPTFASFFPGIAGVYGCPMWVFYTNRGQCITSAGVQDKNSAIIEFQPANKAYRSVALQGFRTFLKVNGKLYEPFREISPHKNELRITADSLKLIEENRELKIRVEVAYFTIPGESFPALARSVTITNLAAKPRKLEMIDGLPIIIPFGFDDSLLKRLSTTIEAWCTVENLEHKAPYYRLKVMPVDISETRLLEKGNFYLAFSDDGAAADIIVDPKIVFGENTDLETPVSFTDKNFRIPKHQLTDGFTPSALAYKKVALAARESFELHSLLGQSDALKVLNRIKHRISNPAYLKTKALENQKLINDVYSAIEIESASKSFDLYSQYTYLDNVMRGGLPVMLGGKVVYLYYRKHGDMERDYNDFKLMPTYFSQGNGNYRDINQNRRNDLFFNPSIGENNIRRFYDLIQLDGFNPLIVLGSQYVMRSAHQAEALLKKHVRRPGKELLETLIRPFILGDLLKEMEYSGIEFTAGREEFVRDLLEKCEGEEGAYHGEGFWTDHFSYNTDLLESYESIYPEKMKELLFGEKSFTFFDSDHIVAPRDEKYRLAGGKVRQYESVRMNAEKSRLINNRDINKNQVRTNYGKGEISHATLFAKLLCLVVNKAASFDAEGIGIEMEADKPDWYDALNGLPGLFGSSLSETLELKRLCLFINRHLSAETKINLPAEAKDFMDGLTRILSEKINGFKCWDESYRIKEIYREETRLGVSGNEAKVDGNEAREFLSVIIKKCDAGIKKALHKYGNYYTYFINEVTNYELIDGDKVKVKAFTQKPLPLFLEGFVHALKVEKDRTIPKTVKASPLYDKALKMYKVNAPLKDSPIEIGRAKIFTPGWLENESVWLHMEYKYMLELLKAGMYKEFFSDFKNVLVPFMDPKKYKRSILENSSFIVSSANPNKENHGRGFVARLSGGAAEFIDIWIIMMTGKNIFRLDEKGKLIFQLSPVLPDWLFKNGRLSFKLLGAIDVTYLNPKKKDTFNGGVKPVSYKLIFDDKEVAISEPAVAEPYASQIRERRVKKIIVTLA